MKVAGFALGLFATAFVLHWLCWRVHRPRSAVRALLLIFLGTLAAGLLASPYIPWLSRFAPTGPWEVLHVCLFHTAFALAYTVTYSALELDSPTLTIMLYVEKAAGCGRTREDLLTLVRNDQIVGSRFEALRSAGIIFPAGTGTYRLTPKGRRWARFFDCFRRIYQLNKGG